MQTAPPSDVETTVQFCRRLQHGLWGGGIGEVRGHDGGPAQFGGELVQPVLTAGDQHQAGAGLTRQATGGGLADAAGGAGDHRDEWLWVWQGPQATPCSRSRSAL